eukprot:SAG11_NODE_7_length_31267_cov_19.541966_13_plen_147_part_00
MRLIDFQVVVKKPGADMKPTVESVAILKRTAITKTRTKLRPLRRTLKDAFKKLDRKTLDKFVFPAFTSHGMARLHFRCALTQPCMCRYRSKHELGPRITTTPMKDQAGMQQNRRPDLETLAIAIRLLCIARLDMRQPRKCCLTWFA